MKHRTLAIILIVLLGGMALFYNKSVSNPTNPATTDGAAKVEQAK
jgi:uncharacterized protein YpmB